MKNLKSESIAKDEKIATLESENAELKSTIEERETRDKVTAKIEEKVKGHRFEETLKERLAECTSEEEVEQKFESEVEFIEKLIESTGTPSGNGEVFKKEPLVLDEAKARQRALAGIKNEEGGSQ